ncbi:D-lactaldehyde dehydrogenase [Mycena leptocephala]|nr:D-lactaldehyde dehydrogenase [Mycena leptocephala]
MPPVTSGKVLVSGVNGFIAAWVVRALLEEGFAVRGAVRSADKCAHLQDIFASYGDKFELVVVPDITKEGAFDEAVQNVDAIEHTASPFHLNADEPEELIVPAIHGTKSVKRVVVTSSCAAVLQVEPEPKTFSELDWNKQAPKEVEEMGRAASPITKYRASKTLAERERDWWDLVVINPPFVFGPTIHDTPTPESLNTSAHQLYTTLTEPSTPATLQSGSCWVDVRDLGRAHFLRFSAPPLAVNASSGRGPESPKYQKGVHGAGKDVVHQIRYDASKSARVLGMTYRSIAETMEDTVADWEARGW